MTDPETPTPTGRFIYKVHDYLRPSAQVGSIWECECGRRWIATDRSLDGKQTYWRRYSPIRWWQIWRWMP